MSSIIEGYNYDIFISYRQKDNKGDRWVSEFVEALKTELESTFKEEISVYFDINPHDGLLETHDVDASLKDKLKCLVFIPIISRTYCDPRSFAWEHEFKEFVEQASTDQFGLKVKLPNGNVASRVLPVRIYDLDSTDIKLCESVLGGVLRGVDFIYKEPGVNKPLTADDDEKKNLNSTKYRIQINKTANAIEEIILGIKTEPIKVAKEKDQPSEPIKKIKEEREKVDLERPAKAINRKLLYIISIVTLLIIAVIIVYPKIFKRDLLENLRAKGKISVAVMPFQNMTNDTTWNVWQDGIQEILTNSLSNSNELTVKQTESINNLIQSKDFANNASITPSVASTVSQRMKTNVFIYGNIIKAGSIIRINAQLVDSKTEEVLKPFQIEGLSSEEDIMRIIDSLSVKIKNTLIISNLGKTVSYDYKNYAYTDSPEAFKNFIYGKNAFLKRDFPTAVNLLSQAVAIDSNFVGALDMLAWALWNRDMFNQAKGIALKLYEKRDQVSIYMKAVLNHTYTYFHGTINEDIKCLKQILAIDDQLPVFYFVLGQDYNIITQFDKAIPELEKSMEIYKKWDSKPGWVLNYTELGFAYHKTGQYNKEKRLYKKAEQDFPDDPSIIQRKVILSFTEGDTVAVTHYIEKYISILKENLSSEADIKNSLAQIYSEAGTLGEAERYYRQTLLLEPDNPNRLNNLAFFLIDKDRNINEGIELVDKSLVSSPDNFNYLHTKGWGLYKQGKYKEALDILQRSWDLRREKAVYNHEAFLHLEEAKKAVAGQK